MREHATRLMLVVALALGMIFLWNTMRGSCPFGGSPHTYSERGGASEERDRPPTADARAMKP